MSERWRTTRTITDDDAARVDRAEVEMEETRTDVTDPYAERRDSAWRLGQVIYVLSTVLVALIALRFVLLLLGANPNAGFTEFVYGVTEPFVAPFEGMFGAPNVETGVFDPASLVAIVVYALLGWVIGKVVEIVTGETRVGLRSSRRSVDRRLR